MYCDVWRQSQGSLNTWTLCCECAKINIYVDFPYLQNSYVWTFLVSYYLCQKYRGEDSAQLWAEMKLQHQPQQPRLLHHCQISIFIWCNVFMVLYCIIWNMKWRTNFFVYLLTRDIRAAKHGAWSTRGGGWVASIVQEPEDFNPAVWLQSVNTVVAEAVWPLHCGVSDVIYFMILRTACQKKPGETADQCSQKVSNL